MKILAVGDIHGDHAYFKHVVTAANKRGCDVILQVGDLGYWPHTDPEFIPTITRQMIKADRWREEHGLQPLYMVWIDGNHECFSGQPGALFETDWPKTTDGFWKVSNRCLYAPRGHRWTWRGATFLALGGGTSIDKQWRLEGGPPGLYWWPEEALTQRDVYNAIEGGRVDVLVAHDMPNGVKLPFNLMKLGPAEQQNRLAVRAVTDAVKPRLILHGHYHVRNKYLLEGDDYRSVVEGLNMNGTYDENYEVLDLGRSIGLDR